MKKREEIIVRLTFKFSSATLQKKNEDLHFPHKQKTAKLEDSVQEKNLSAPNVLCHQFERIWYEIEETELGITTRVNWFSSVVNKSEQNKVQQKTAKYTNKMLFNKKTQQSK